jgi:hypothetical protein
MRFRSATSTTTALVATLSISFAALAATPSLAHADDREDPAAARVPLVPVPGPEGSQVDAPATERVFYGWQNLGMDAASLGLFFAGAYYDGDGATALGLAGLGGYLFGSPVVHALHGHTGRAAGSLAMRVGVPLALYGITWAVEDHPDCSNDGGWFCGLDAALMPIFVGALGAGAVMIADDFGLAYDQKPVGPSWTPTVSAGHGGMTFGIAGTF